MLLLLGGLVLRCGLRLALRGRVVAVAIAFVAAVATVAAIALLLAAAAKHLQGVGADFGGVAILARLRIGPFARADGAFDVHL